MNDSSKDQNLGWYSAVHSGDGFYLLEIQGLSLREMIHEFKYQTLILFKALLLQPKVCSRSFVPEKLTLSDSNWPIKMLFFGTRCERLCMLQFSLISLIPGLINSLEDCADPSFDNYAQSVEKPTSLKTSDRSSCTIGPNRLRLRNLS